MENLVEFTCIIVTTDSEDERLVDMGIQTEESIIQEKIVRYSFNPATITEVRETYTKYRGEWQPAVVATFTDSNYETPPLLTTYDEFKQKINEHNKKNT